MAHLSQSSLDSHCFNKIIVYVNQYMIRNALNDGFKYCRQHCRHFKQNDHFVFPLIELKTVTAICGITNIGINKYRINVLRYQNHEQSKF